MDLKELLGDELFTKVTEKAGKNKIDIITKENYIDKHEYDLIKEQNKELVNQIKDRDTQLKDLADKAKDNEEVKKAFEELKLKNENDLKAYEGKMQEYKFNSALERALISSNAHDIKALLPYIDKNNLKVNDNDSIVGLEDQISSLKKDKAFLFKNIEFKTPDPYFKDDDKKINNDGIGASFAKKKNDSTKQAYDPWNLNN